MKSVIKKALAVLAAATVVFSAFSCADNSVSINDLMKSNTKSGTETDRYKTVTAAATEAKTEPVTAAPETKPVTAAETKNQTPPETEAITGQTQKPVINGTVNVNPALVCVAGSCEPGSKIYIRGGVADVSYVSDDKYFIGTIEIPATGSTTVSVSARVKGKNESEAVAVTLKYDAKAQHIRDDAFEVVVGNNYQCHFVSALPDYTGSNLMTESQTETLKKNVKSNVAWLKDNMGGAELIYLVIPNPMTVYPETVPSAYTQFVGKGRTDQFCEAAKAGGAVVINLTDVFKQHKNDEFKLFHRTDSHWTQYGAWLAYTELMNYISKKYPAAVPRTEKEMGFYYKDVNGGDMPYYLTLDEKKVRERAVFANPTFESPANMLYFKSENDLMMNHDTTPKAATYTTGNAGLPNIYVMRDSFGIAMYNLLPERFNKTVYKDMWSYGFDKDGIKASGANYVLYIMAERNLGELLY